jgi:hypothetical protein
MRIYTPQPLFKMETIVTDEPAARKPFSTILNKTFRPCYLMLLGYLLIEL